MTIPQWEICPCFDHSIYTKLGRNTPKLVSSGWPDEAPTV